MSRTVKSGEMKSTIFFTITLLAVTLWWQSPARGQTPPVVRTPRIAPVAQPTPAPNAKPNRPIAVSTIRPLPDLRITDIQYDAKSFRLYIRVVNEGLAAADRFNVWVKIVNGKNPGDVIGDAPIEGLAPNEGRWVNVYAGSTGSTFYGNYLPPAMDNALRVQAIADARYLYRPESRGHITGKISPKRADELYKPGSPVPQGMQDSQLDVAEANEDNNELVADKADIKPYTPPPAIRRRP